MASEIVKTDKGIFIPADYRFKWTDAKTGIEFDIPARDLTASGAGYVIMYGWRKSSADSHAAVKDDVDKAKETINARVDAIKAGSVKPTGGGRKGDPYTTEAVAIARTASGLSVKAFTDKYGSGKDAVNAYVSEAVKAGIKSKGLRVSKEDRDAIVARNVKAMMDKARAKVDARKGEAAIVLDVSA